jgi:hypothetical protein
MKFGEGAMAVMVVPSLLKETKRHGNRRDKGTAADV